MMGYEHDSFNFTHNKSYPILVPSAQFYGLLRSSIRGAVEQGRTIRTVLWAWYGIPRFEDRASKSPRKFGNTAFL